MFIINVCRDQVNHKITQKHTKQIRNAHEVSVSGFDFTMDTLTSCAFLIYGAINVPAQSSIQLARSSREFARSQIQVAQSSREVAQSSREVAQSSRDLAQ